MGRAKAGRRQLLPKSAPGGYEKGEASSYQDYSSYPTSYQHKSPPQATQPSPAGFLPALFPRSLPPIVSSFPGFHIQTPLVRRSVPSDLALMSLGHRFAGRQEITGDVFAAGDKSLIKGMVISLFEFANTFFNPNGIP